MPETSDARTIDVGQEFMADFQVEVLSAEKTDDGKRGKVTALVSAYNKPYRMGFATYHQVDDGAFSASLKANSSVPLFWQHNWAFSEQPPIGHAQGREESTGLVVEGEFYLDTEAGRSVFNAMDAGAIREWSIGYRITRYEIEEGDEKDTIFVKEADLMEASAVLRGANPHTETLKVASESDVLSALAEVTGSTVELAKAQSELVSTLAMIATAVNVIEERVATLEAPTTVPVPVPAPVEVVETPDEISEEPAVEEAGEPVECWFLGCHEDASHDVIEGGDIKACDAHKVAGSKDAPQPSVAGSGEGAPVEPTVEGGESTPEAASGPTPRVPSFLPQPPPDYAGGPEDITCRTRVMRAWEQAGEDAKLRQVIGSR